MIKFLETQINKVVLAVLARGMRVLYRKDSRVRAELESWKKGLTIRLVCGPGGAVLALRQNDRFGVMQIPGARKADITMRFKSVSGAFQVLSGQVGISEAYSRHFFSLEGDIFQTMSFVRCVEYLEASLFPRFLATRILREIPEKKIGMLSMYMLTALERPGRG